jgi:hypothetical protein
VNCKDSTGQRTKEEVFIEFPSVAYAVKSECSFSREFAEQIKKSFPSKKFQNPYNLSVFANTFLLFPVTS